MKVTGLSVVFVDVPREKEGEFNHWYDLDHVPEMCAMPEVLAARRYRAEDAIMKYRFDKHEQTPPIGPARYCTLYFFGPEQAGKQERRAEFRKRLVAE